MFVCTGGETCPTQRDVEQFMKYLRGECTKAGLKDEVRINKAGCVWYHGVQESDLKEVFESHIRDGRPVKRLLYEPGVKGPNKKPGTH